MVRIHISSIDLISSITGLIELRRIEAAEDIASQLSKTRNIVYLPQGPQMLLNVSGAAQ